MGMINYETLLSSYDDKLTLMQWLKKVEAALKNASASAFSVNKKGNATISFSLTFEDGTSLESGDIVLQQGESVASARIENGDLILTLTNGDELNAGNMFNGNITINGDVKAKTLTQNEANYSQLFSFSDTPNVTIDNIFNRFVVINNVLWVIVNIKITALNTATLYLIGSKYVTIPSSISSAIYDLKGDSCNLAVQGNPVTIAGIKASVFNSIENVTPTLSTDNVNFGIAHHTSDSLLLTFSSPGLAMNANDVKYLTARIPLSLI